MKGWALSRRILFVLMGGLGGYLLSTQLRPTRIEGLSNVLFLFITATILLTIYHDSFSFYMSEYRPNPDRFNSPKWGSRIGIMYSWGLKGWLFGSYFGPPNQIVAMIIALGALVFFTLIVVFASEFRATKNSGIHETREARFRPISKTVIE